MQDLWNSAAHGGLQGYAVVYLVIAALCFAVALRQLRRILVPLGAIFQVLAATTAMVLAMSATLVLIFAALLSGGR
jgi:hypothetical protein